MDLASLGTKLSCEDFCMLALPKLQCIGNWVVGIGMLIESICLMTEVEKPNCMNA